MYQTPLELKVQALEERVRRLEGGSKTVASMHETWTAPEPVQPEVAHPKRTDSTETWLGQHGLSFIGIALLLLGIGFLVVYSIQYLGPWGRDLLGLGSALLLFALSRYIERTMKGFGQFLFAGSAALSYFTVYAMHFFDVSRVISSQPVDLALLIVVGILATWYALKRYETEMATTLAYCLVYLTFFVGDLSLFSFWALLVATIGVVGLAAWKKWTGALLAGVLLTYGTYFFWGVNLGGTAELFGSDHQLTFDTLFLGLYFLLFSLPTFVMNEHDDQSPVVVLVMNAILYTALFGQSIDTGVEHGFAYVLLGMSVFHYLYALVAQLYTKQKLQEAAIVIGSLALLGAIPLYWSDVSMAWAWLLVGAIEVVLSLTLKQASLRATGLLSITLATLHFFFLDLLLGDVIGSTTLTTRLALGLVLAVMTLGIAQLFRHREGVTEHQGLRLYLNFIGSGALIGLAGTELESTYITLTWGLIGVTTLLAGIGLKDQQLRNPAFLVVLLMLARVVFIDLAEAETVIRIVSFILLGIVLLTASWMYRKYLTDDIK